MFTKYFLIREYKNLYYTLTWTRLWCKKANLFACKQQGCKSACTFAQIWKGSKPCGFRQEDTFKVFILKIYFSPCDHVVSYKKKFFKVFILKIYFSPCDLDIKQAGTIWNLRDLIIKPTRTIWTIIKEGYISRDFSKFWSSRQTLSWTWPNSLLYSITYGPIYQSSWHRRQSRWLFLLAATS